MEKVGTGGGGSTGGMKPPVIGHPNPVPVPGGGVGHPVPTPGGTGGGTTPGGGTGAGGTTASGGPTTYPASDGSPVTASLDATGKVVDARGTGKDGMARHYWVDAKGQHYAEGNKPELNIGIVIDQEKQTIEFSQSAGAARLDYVVDCSPSATATSLESARFIVTRTWFTSGVQSRQDTRTLTSSQLREDYGPSFTDAMGAGYESRVAYFAPVFAAVFKAHPPAPRPDGTISKAIGWGLSVFGVAALGLLLAPVAAGVTAVELGLFLFDCFMFGFDASLWDTYNTDTNNNNNGSGGAEGSGGTGGGGGSQGTPGPVTEGGDGGDGCFVAGTLVDTGATLMPIDAMHIGDSILAVDVDERSAVHSTVETVHVSRRRTILDLDFAIEHIRCTPPHRFFTGEWVPAERLAVGDKVLARDGAWHTLRGVRSEEQPQAVFNLTVADTHTYLVGNTGFVVHNTKTTDPGPDGGDGDGPPEEGDKQA